MTVAKLMEGITMLSNMPSIKEKLPPDYLLPSQALYYCEEDDSFHLTRKDASYRYHKCLIAKAGRAITTARQHIEDELAKIRNLKTKSLPQMQKTLNAINERLRELLSIKDWKTTHATHAAKRREILELRYRRMFIVGELKKEILKLDCAKRAYRDAKDYLKEAEARLLKEKMDAEKAEEFWKEHKEEKA